MDKIWGGGDLCIVVFRVVICNIVWVGWGGVCVVDLGGGVGFVLCFRFCF